MNVSHNFVSVVVLGNFNPAIVTPDFLNKVCLLNLGVLVEASPSNVPVFRSLRFQDLEIFIDLMRLSVTQKPIRDIRSTRVLEVFRSYFDKLPFTPISAVGVNINCEIRSQGDANTGNLGKKVRDINRIMGFFGVDALEVSEKILATKRGEEWKESNFRIENVKNFIRQIEIKKKDNAVVLNYNYEAGQVEKEPQTVKMLLENYEDFCTEFEQFLKLLEVSL